VARDDGLVLRGAYVAAVNRCAPPGNKPTTEERDRCLPFLEREVRALTRLRSIVALGAFAWDGALRAIASAGHETPRPRPRFGHGAEAQIGPYVLVGAFHPSQQNTFTGKLTPGMLDEALRRAVALSG
jgi:uracil-DNA glycosylase family 4